MKSKVALFSLVSLMFPFAALAQGIENDDMYFNSKDRAKLNTKKASEVSYSASIKKDKKKEMVEEYEPVNPTDSYSSRNVNPEFAARSNSEMAQSDNQDYFVNNYQYNRASNFNNWNNSFNNWYSNPWYGNNYYDPFINSWNSPYYGSYYDSWGNPWRNPYYRSGWSSSFSYYWGNSWDYGWGNNFGVGYGYNNFYGNPYRNGWGSGYYNNYYQPVVVINNNNEGGRGVVYGKRATSRSEVAGQNLNRDTGSRSRATNNSNAPNGGRLGSDNSGGRVATPPTRRQQDDYYNRSWRSTNSQGTQSAPSRSSGDNSNWNGGNSNRSGSYDNQRSRTFESPAPSRSGSYDAGGGSRSNSSGSSSGSSGGSRGRSRD